MTERHPSDLEELAAYIDGRLSGERKERVEQRLLRDEDYYEVFLETVRFQQENGRGRKAATVPVVRWRTWGTWGIATSLAAAAVLVLVIGLPRSDRAGSPGAWAVQLDADAIVARGEAWADPGWSRLRSATIPRGRYRPEELAFRLGVRAVDLRVALAAGDQRTAATLVAQIEALARAADLFPAASSYGIQVDGADPEALLAQVAEAEGRLAGSFEDGSHEAHRLALGGWAEAGRLAALTRDAGALGRILRNAPDARSSDEIRPQVETLESVLERPDPNRDGFDAAAAAFSEILRALAG